MEQRKSQRFDLKLPFEMLGGDTRLKIQGETRNVSSSGVLFTAEIPMDIGESIEYFITLAKAPGTRVDVRLRCVGKVVRSEADSGFAATMERYEFIRQRT